MQIDNRLLDDVARVASGALGAMVGVKDEFEVLLRQQFERVLASMDLVPREEFDAVKEMAAKARAEQETLRARLEALEAEAGVKPRRRKPAPRPRRAKPKSGPGPTGGGEAPPSG